MKSLVAILSVAILSAVAPAAWAQAKPGGSTPGQSGRSASPPTVDLRVCNYSGHNATVAVSYVEVGGSQFVNRGWYDVANGACSSLVTTDNANFYFYADATDSSGVWGGDHNLCVEYPGPYTFYSTGSTECESWQELRGFLPAHADEPGTWTWTLNP